jgi:kanamycin kinase
VWRLERDGATRYLKLGRSGGYPGMAAEAARLSWAAAHLPVPHVVDVGTDGTVEWLITAGLPGQPGTCLARGDPRVVVTALGEGLRRFHDAAPVDRCPFDFRLESAMAHARRRVHTGLVDATQLNDDHRRFASADATLARLESLRPSHDDLVVCHGDYCPPNALLADNRVVAYVDLGELGVADRWWDVAIGTWSATWNFGNGLEELFLASYGIGPGPDRQVFYRLLYDLAS